MEISLSTPYLPSPSPSLEMFGSPLISPTREGGSRSNASTPSSVASLTCNKGGKIVHFKSSRHLQQPRENTHGVKSLGIDVHSRRPSLSSGGKKRPKPLPLRNSDYNSSAHSHLQDATVSTLRLRAPKSSPILSTSATFHLPFKSSSMSRLARQPSQLVLNQKDGEGDDQKRSPVPYIPPITTEPLRLSLTGLTTSPQQESASSSASSSQSRTSLPSPYPPPTDALPQTPFVHSAPPTLPRRSSKRHDHLHSTRVKQGQAVDSAQRTFTEAQEAAIKRQKRTQAPESAVTTGRHTAVTLRQPATQADQELKTTNVLVNASSAEQCALPDSGPRPRPLRTVLSYDDDGCDREELKNDSDGNSDGRRSKGSNYNRYAWYLREADVNSPVSNREDSDQETETIGPATPTLKSLSVTLENKAARRMTDGKTWQQYQKHILKPTNINTEDQDKGASHPAAASSSNLSLYSSSSGGGGGGGGSSCTSSTSNAKITVKKHPGLCKERLRLRRQDEITLTHEDIFLLDKISKGAYSAQGRAMEERLKRVALLGLRFEEPIPGNTSSNVVKKGTDNSTPPSTTLGGNLPWPSTATSSVDSSRKKNTTTSANATSANRSPARWFLKLGSTASATKSAVFSSTSTSVSTCSSDPASACDSVDRKSALTTTTTTKANSTTTTRPATMKAARPATTTKKPATKTKPRSLTIPMGGGGGGSTMSGSIATPSYARRPSDDTRSIRKARQSLSEVTRNYAAEAAASHGSRSIYSATSPRHSTCSDRRSSEVVLRARPLTSGSSRSTFDDDPLRRDPPPGVLRHRRSASDFTAIDTNGITLIKALRHKLHIRDNDPGNDSTQNGIEDSGGGGKNRFEPDLEAEIDTGNGDSEDEMEFCD